MKTPGDWSLLWANHERNGMTWTDIVNGIRAEQIQDLGDRSEFEDFCPACGHSKDDE